MKKPALLALCGFLGVLGMLYMSKPRLPVGCCVDPSPLIPRDTSLPLIPSDLFD